MTQYALLLFLLFAMPLGLSAGRTVASWGNTFTCHQEIEPFLELLIDDEHELTSFAEKMIKKKSFYDDPAYFDFFQADKEKLKKLIARWYGDYAPELINTIRTSLGTEYLVLLADPGIANRVPQLIRFAKEELKVHKKLTPWVLRKKFSHYLGKRKIYRGVVLTKEQRARVSQTGLEALGMTEPSLNSKQIIKDSFSSRFKSFARRKGESLGPLEELESRLAFNGKFNFSTRMWMSVSGHKEIAESVGFHWSPFRGSQKHKLYVIEADVPEISVIEKNGIFKYEEYDLTMKRGTTFKILFQEPSVELFIPYIIKRRDIVKVSEYDTPPEPLVFEWNR